MRMIAVGALLAVGVLAGCQVERAPSRADLKEKKQEAKAEALVAPKYVAPTHVDEAQLVVGACGKAASDVVLPIYNKEDNGPVRRMTYRGLKMVVLDFVPTVSVPRAGQTAPRAELPANAVWEFSEARMEQEELMTSKRLMVYLPCAARALQK